MPRAYYKPFTAYEDLLGFHRIKVLSYFVMGGLFGSLALKCYLFVGYSGNVDIAGQYGEPLSEERMRLMAERAERAQAMNDFDAHRKSTPSSAALGGPQTGGRRRALLPPA